MQREEKVTTEEVSIYTYTEQKLEEAATGS
jgi:hypothetical protein